MAEPRYITVLLNNRLMFLKRRELKQPNFLWKLWRKIKRLIKK